MIQRFIGVSIGALVTFGILWFTTVSNPVDLIPWYATAAIIGAIASFFWPVVVGRRAASRARERRDDEIEREVQRQVAEQTRDN